MLFLLHLGLEEITEVDTDTNGGLCPLRLLPLMIEFSVCVPSGYSTREQLAREKGGGDVLRDDKSILK